MRIGLTRFEWRKENDLSDANDLLNLAFGHAIEKTRCHSPFLVLNHIFNENKKIFSLSFLVSQYSASIHPVDFAPPRKVNQSLYRDRNCFSERQYNRELNLNRQREK